MGFFVELAASALLLVGGIFLLVGSIGLARLPDFFMRLHAPTKSTTLGIGSILMASMLVFTVRQGTLSIHELMITLFLFMTAPIAAHMMAKAALHLRLKTTVGTRNPAVIEQARERKTES